MFAWHFIAQQSCFLDALEVVSAVYVNKGSSPAKWFIRPQLLRRMQVHFL